MWEIKSVTLGKSSGCQNGNRNEIQLPTFYVVHGNSPANTKGNWRGDYLVKCFYNIIIILIIIRKIHTILQKARWIAAVCQAKVSCHWPWPSDSEGSHRITSYIFLMLSLYVAIAWEGWDWCWVLSIPRRRKPPGKQLKSLCLLHLHTLSLLELVQQQHKCQDPLSGKHYWRASVSQTR